MSHNTDSGMTDSGMKNGNARVSLSGDRPICIAILAIGGQGGGVVSNWLVALAESQGWRAQSTSVPGVAQRTGATIYYVELIKPGEGEAVLSLMPTPGDVDLVVAAEWMEAGRAMQRGLVSPDRTTFIASTHRALSLAEKMLPADGTRDPEAVDVAAKAASKRFLKADLAQIAADNGSVISASLFGAIAASQALPFTRDAFEQAIRDGGIGVASSLAAFTAAHSAIERGEADAVTIAVPEAANDDIDAPRLNGGDASQQAQYAKLCERMRDEFPASTQQMLTHGINRVVDFHDCDYGEQYLEHMSRIHALATAHAGGDAVTTAVAKYLATAMAYQDVIRVADLKTRAARFERVRNQAGAEPSQIVKVTEFMHPRLEELCGLMPSKLGKRVENSPTLTRIASFFTRGRRIRTDSMFGFLTLYAVAGLRRSRLKSLRHEREMNHVECWLGRIQQACENANNELAVEIAQCQRLIKGYSDTHVRGQSKFTQIMKAIDRLMQHPQAAEQVAALREAALAKADDDQLQTRLAAVDELVTDQATA